MACGRISSRLHKDVNIPAFLFQPCCVWHRECPAQQGSVCYRQSFSHTTATWPFPHLPAVLSCDFSALDTCVEHSWFAWTVTGRRGAAVALQQEKSCGAGLNRWAVSGEHCQEVRHSLVLHSFLPARILAHKNFEIKCCEAPGYLFKRQEIIEKSLMKNSHFKHSGTYFIPVLLLLRFYSPPSSPHGLHSHILPLVSDQVRAPWRKVVFS